MTSLIKMLDDLWAKSDRYRRLGLELPAGEEPRTIDLNEHHQILELVIARDAAGAGATDPTSHPEEPHRCERSTHLKTETTQPNRKRHRPSRGCAPSIAGPVTS